MNKRNIILILGFAGFVSMADNWVVSPILPAIANDLHVNIATASVIITAYMLPFGLCQLVYGYLAERFGKRQVITLSICLFTVSTALCAIATSIPSLTVFRALTGIFAASVMPISIAFIGDLFPIQERQSAIGAFMGITYLGQGLSMAIGGSISQFLSWQGTFAVYSGLAVISSILFFTIGRKIPSKKNSQCQVLRPYINILKRKSSVIIYILVLFEGIFLFGSFSFMGGFLKASFDLSYFYIGMVMTAFGLAAIVSGPQAGKVAARIGRMQTAVLGLASVCLADILMVIGVNWLPVVIIGVGFMGLGMMFAHTTFVTVATEFAASSRGFAMSLIAFCFMGGGGIGTAIGSRIVAGSGYESLFISYAIGLFVVVLVAILVRGSFQVDVKANPKN